MTCWLCSRQFKTVDMLKRHSNESALHKVITTILAIYLWSFSYYPFLRPTWASPSWWKRPKQKWKLHAKPLPPPQKIASPSIAIVPLSVVSHYVNPITRCQNKRTGNASGPKVRPHQRHRPRLPLYPPRTRITLGTSCSRRWVGARELV